MNVAVSRVMIEVRRSHLLGLAVAAVALGAVATWALGLAIDSRSDRIQPRVAAATRADSSTQAVLANLSPSARAYVEGIMDMTDAELAAAFGTQRVIVSSPTTRADSSTQAVLANLSPSARAYVEGIMDMTDAELAAAFGTQRVIVSSPTTRADSSTQAVLANLSPSARAYVEGIMDMTDAELAAAFGTGPDAQSSSGEASTIPLGLS